MGAGNPLRDGIHACRADRTVLHPVQGMESGVIPNPNPDSDGVRQWETKGLTRVAALSGRSSAKSSRASARRRLPSTAATWACG